MQFVFSATISHCSRTLLYQFMQFMQPSKKMDQAAGASQLALVSCKPAVKWFISRDLWMCGIFAILRAPICFRLQRLICCWGVVKCSCKCWFAPPMRSRWICEPIKIQQWERYQTCYLFTVGLLHAFSLFQDCGVGPNNRLCCHISQQHLIFNQLSLLYFVLFPNRPILHCVYKPSINWASSAVYLNVSKHLLKLNSDVWVCLSHSCHRFG